LSDAPELEPEHTDPTERVRALEAALGEQEARLAGLVRIAGNLGRSRDPRKAMRAMVAEISELLHADRTTIYEIRGEMLHGLAVQGEASVLVGVPVGTGIAGQVASRGKSINLKDAYRHPSFDPKFDKLTGYRTRSMLCVPMRSPKRDIIGVVQVLNKQEGYFTVDDEHLLTALAGQAGITLEALQLQLRLNISNAELTDLSRQLQQKVHELELLFGNERAVSESDTTEQLADRLLMLSAQVARCEATALFLPEDSGYGPAYVRGPDADDALRVSSRLEIGEGILGKTASRGEALMLTGEAFTDAAVPRQLGGEDSLCVDDAISVPLLHGGRTIGAFALVGRRDLDRRDDEEDQRLAVLVAGQLARGVVRLAEHHSAQQRDRLMTIGQMLSGVMHDLRGPMSIISGYSQLMAEADDPDEREQMSDSIRRQVSHFNDMTRELLAFVRGERRVFVRKVYLDKFAKAAAEAMKSEFGERGIHFELRQEVDTGLAWFDEAKMMRVVTNIARNARQAMDEGGEFVWTIREGEGRGVEFELADTGPGIPESIRDRLFEAFTTSGKADGTGLGLAIVRRIVEDHHGTIGFDTETGVGTTFRIALPPPENQ